MMTLLNRLQRAHATLGTITSGYLRSADGTRYFDLDATGASPFIGHPSFQLLANGNATFSGSLSAATGSFAGSLSAATGSFAGTVTLTDGSSSVSFKDSGGVVNGKLETYHSSALVNEQGVQITAVDGAAASHVLQWATTQSTGGPATLQVPGRVQVVASDTSRATLNIPHGSAPTSPMNGDMWTTTAGLYVRINGTTIGPLT